MTTHRAALVLFFFIIALVTLGLTAERLASRLSWIGAALLTLTVGCWVMS